MIRITRQGTTSTGSVTDDPSGSVKAHHYRIAGQSLVFQTPVAALSAFAQGEASSSFTEVLARSSEVALLNQDNATLVYQGRAPFENEIQDVACWRQNGHLQLDVSGNPVCSVDAGEDHIHLLNDRSFDDQLNLEVLTGPALILLLAKKGIYCLHAGAVATPLGNIALIAESGTGKSTLSQNADQSWQQIADDILPLHFNERIEILPEFPQLKLESARVASAFTDSLSLDLIVRLVDDPAEQISMKRLPRTDALLQIVRHTVAAKLFDNDQMREHARFAKRLSGEVAVVEMHFPRDLQRLPELRDTITGYLQENAKEALT